MKRVSSFLCVLVLGTLVSTFGAEAEHVPVPVCITTPWTEKVDPKDPWPEYPRPQMVRADWTSLNGIWQYAFLPAGVKPGKYDGEIVVPFPVESPLSKVRKAVPAGNFIWYRRMFTAPQLNDGQRLCLNFEAVDWEAVVFVNNQEIGTHRGGYDCFSFDITDAVKSGTDNDLVVRVKDGGQYQPVGKQNPNAIFKPQGVYYAQSSGIWHPVWLEVVPAVYIRDLRITPDVDNSTVTVQVNTSDGTSSVASVSVLDSGKVIAEGLGTNLTLKVTEVKTWSPDTPFLYDLIVRVGADEVRSYFGMRKIALGKDEKGVLRMFLNGKPVFMAGPLDQGFWPDGHHTAPTDEALRFDLEVMKKLGFNMVRKHVKVESRRWFYWCDKLGLLVWQDMPSPGAAGKHPDKSKEKLIDPPPSSKENASTFERELAAMIHHHFNSPAVIMWVIFNENWGQYDTARLTEHVRALDPTRLINSTSGWHDRGVGDIIDVHAYPGPKTPVADGKRACVLGEFGGLGWIIPEHTLTGTGFGYRTCNSMRTLGWSWFALWKEVLRMRDEQGLCAAVYTQITDVETECNGILTYDRKVLKVDDKATRVMLTCGEIPKTQDLREVLPPGSVRPATWRYTNEKPADNWNAIGFDDGQWKSGKIGIVKTEERLQWKEGHIWMRQVFDLPAETSLRDSVLKLKHGQGFELYINGELVVSRDSHGNEPYDLGADTRRLFRPGRNVLAIHSRANPKLPVVMDVGLAEVMP